MVAISNGIRDNKRFRKLVGRTDLIIRRVKSSWHKALHNLTSWQTGLSFFSFPNWQLGYLMNIYTTQTYKHKHFHIKREYNIFPIFLFQLRLKSHYWLNLCERKMIYVLQNICRWYLFYNTLSVPVCIISISWNTLFPLPYCINLSILWYISCYSIV